MELRANFWRRQAGFNGATSARSWKSFIGSWTTCRRVASMGPRARARGNEDGGGEVVVVAIASMGPRARARGNLPTDVLPTGDAGASMGPRARARGNTEALLVTML